MPRDHQRLDPVHNLEEQSAQDAEEHECGEESRRIEGRLRDQENAAQSAVARDELADDGADQGQRDAHLHSSEDARQRILKPDFPQRFRGARMAGFGRDGMDTAHFLAA